MSTKKEVNHIKNMVLARWKKVYGKPLDGPMPTLEERFWSKVDKSGECWLWLGSKGPDGYGYLGTGTSKSARAHRVAYWVVYGSIPNGQFVLHHCDNPSCVRPDHLFLGTQQDNMNDMVNKGRSAKGDRSPTRLHPESIAYGAKHGRHTHPEKTARGEKVWTAKLNWDKVREIRTCYTQGKITTRELGRHYGVYHSTIVKIVNGKTWQEQWNKNE